MDNADAFLEGIKDAVRLMQVGIDKGLSVEEAFECLKTAAEKTAVDVEFEKVVEGIR